MAGYIQSGLGIDQRFTWTELGVTSTYLTDALGSTVALANSSGTVQTSYGYDPWGETYPSGSTTGSTYQFAGREHNAATNLYYNRARYYRPAWSRFISEDPIEFAGGINRYTYAGNNPVEFRDPMGKFGWGGAIIGAVAGAVGGYETGGGVGAAFGAVAGAIVGGIAPALSGQVGAAVGAAYGSAAGIAASATTFAGLGALGGADAQMGINLWNGNALGDDVPTSALIGAGATVLSGEAILVGMGEQASTLGLSPSYSPL